VESQDRTIVGVNKFVTEKERIKDIFKISAKVGKDQARKLKVVKKKRRNAKVTASLEDLKKRAATGENLMPAIVECVESYASLGEICDLLRSVWGEYRESVLV
jgi:methylmalonyl-CoA mutase N-terminal domain/subunit